MGEQSGQSMRIVFSSSIDGLTEQNSSFDKGILRVCYTGKNRNGSYISKDAIERCISSIYNCPIVCNYDRESDSIGAHDMEIVSDGAGMRLVNVTQPVGVVPESASYWWTTIEDDSGTHEYLCVDVLLWKRQEAYQRIKENGITDESMEISIKDGGMKDGVFFIDRFEFTAFCLLGSAEPCYESAALVTFSLNDMKTQIADMMQDLKETYSITSAQTVDDTKTNNFSMEGGKAKLNEKEELARSFGFEPDKLDFSIEDFSIEQLREKFTKMQAEAEKAQFALEMEFQNELRHALEAEQVDTPWGKDSHYWLWDYDKELSEVYGIDMCDGNLYGFPYSMDGDHAVIDFAGKKRMKLALEPFDEGTQSAQPAPLPGMFTRMTELYTANDKAWQEKFQAETEKVSALETELTGLRKFKTDTEDAAAKMAREEVLEKFSDLNGVEAFEQLREDCANYTLDALEEKCFAIRGRNGMSAKFSYTPQSVVLPIEKGNGGMGEAKHEPYGGIFTEYGFSAE